MSLCEKSKYAKKYYGHVLKEQDAPECTDTEKMVFDIISDLSDRRGLRQEWEQIDGDIQDEIIENWIKIVEKNQK